MLNIFLKSLFLSVVFLFLLRVILLALMFLGPIFFVFSPLMFFVAEPIYGFFVMVLITFFILYRKSKKIDNSNVVDADDKIINILGFLFGIGYVVWFHFFVPFSPIGLDSMNCLGFPCEGTSYFEIVSDSAPTFLGLNYSEDNKIYNESTKKENISSCFDLKYHNQQADCVSQILFKTKDPQVCADLNNKKDIYKISYSDVQFCYYNVATKTGNPEVCNLMPQDLVDKYDESLTELRNSCLHKFAEMSFEDGDFTNDKVKDSCSMIKNNDFRKAHCYAFIGYIEREPKICDEMVIDVANSRKNDDYKSLCNAEYYSWMYGQRLISLDSYENVCKNISYVPSRNKCLITVMADRKDVSYCEYVQDIKEPESYSEKLRTDDLNARNNCLYVYNRVKDSQY